MAEPDITIPREALVKAAKVLHDHAEIFVDVPWEDLSDGDQEAYIEEARATCIAMLKNWPGMKLNPSWELRTHKRSVEMILPMSEPPRMDRKSAVAERLFGDD